MKTLIILYRVDIETKKEKTKQKNKTKRKKKTNEQRKRLTKFKIVYLL